MYRGRTVALIIPALDEEGAIGPLVSGVDRAVVAEVIVGDNGSRDRTAARAAAAGAKVVAEPRRGYGSACLTAIAAADPATDVYLFMDGDGSDDPSEIGAMLDRLVDANADLVIGSRVTGEAERGALTPVQAFGNALTCTLVRWLWGVRYTDLGPFRAIRRDAYERLAMADPDFGWTIEMQVKAAQHGLRIVEMPVRRRVRAAGESKVSGNIRGSVAAGRRILGYVFAAKLAELRGR